MRIHPLSTTATVALASASLLLTAPANAVPPRNDNFARAQTLQMADPEGVPCVSEGDSENFDATRQPGERRITDAATAQTVWFRWTPVATGCAETVTIDTAGSDFDTVMAVYSTNRLSQLPQALVGENDDVTPGTLHSSVTFTPEAGTTYRIQVAGIGRNSVGNVLVQATQE
jgi:serine protease